MRRTRTVARLLSGERRRRQLLSSHAPSICSGVGARDDLYYCAAAAASPSASAFARFPGRQQQCSFFSSQKATNTSSSRKSSVSSEEVAHFDTLAADWWDDAKNPLIGMNPTRVSYMLDQLRQVGIVSQQQDQSRNQPLRGIRALDVGCGGGLLSESLARLGADVTAVDPSLEVTNVASLHSQHHALTRQNINYRGGMSVEDLSREILGGNIEEKDHEENGDDNSSKDKHNDNNPDESLLFDVVCVLEVVEHATDPSGLLHNASRLLRPGGILFVSTLNRTAKSYVLAIAGAEHIMRMVPVGTHTWEKFLSPTEVGTMVTSAGLNVVDVCGMVLVPPFINMRWALDRNDLDVNWIGTYQKQ